MFFFLKKKEKKEKENKKKSDIQKQSYTCSTETFYLTRVEPYFGLDKL